MIALHRVKHLVHCGALISTMIYYGYFEWSLNESLKENEVPVNLLLRSLLRISFPLFLLITAPIAISTISGLLFFGAFNDKEVSLEYPPNSGPFICFRVVTRGDFPDLVKENTWKNLGACLDNGMVDRFRIEVVTEQPLNLPKEPLIREIVVPKDYCTPRGTLYKARNLNYCLQEKIHDLKDDDWIVHLDEDTIMDGSAVRGIINFVGAGKHSVGQGIIIYECLDMSNLLIAVSCLAITAFDCGMLRFQYNWFQRAIFHCKGSFWTIKAGLEHKIGFDFGPEGSISEDLYFSFRCVEENQSTGMVSGLVYEQSPPSFKDMFKQRHRWISGRQLLSGCFKLGYFARILEFLNLYDLIAMPISMICRYYCYIYSIPNYPVFATLWGVFIGYRYYVGFFGAIKSLNLSQVGLFRYIFITAFSTFFSAMIMGFSYIPGKLRVLTDGPTNNFYVVTKSQKVKTG